MAEYADAMYRAVFEQYPSGLVLVNADGTIRRANKAIFTSFGMEEWQFHGLRFGNLFHCHAVCVSGALCGTTAQCDNCEMNRSITATLKHGRITERVTVCYKYRMGAHTRKKWFEVSFVPIWCENDNFLHMTFFDISHIKDNEELLRNKLERDPLTGVASRQGLDGALLRLKTSGKGATLAMVDMDGFKTINDSLGHVTGDRVLELFGSVSLANTRAQDTVGRYGGDEFLLVLPEAKTENAVALIGRLGKSFQDACHQKAGLHATFSTGVVWFSAEEIPASEPDQLIERVDRSLYVAKRAGPGKLAVGGTLIEKS